VFESVCGVIERRLKLKVNREKSSIRHAAQATLLGFGFFFDGPRVGIRIAPKAIQRLKDQLRTLTRRRWSVSMDYRIGRLNRLITGSMAYFRLAQPITVGSPARRPLDGRHTDCQFGANGRKADWIPSHCLQQAARAVAPH
jgi:hypothetical protein